MRSGRVPINAVSVQLLASGDHSIHSCDVERDGVYATWDNDSQVLDVHIDEGAAKDIYFWLLEVIPKLQRDRR